MDIYFKQYSWQRDVLISGGAVLVFAFVGPFGTFGDMGFAIRLLFWAIAVFGCGAIFWLVVVLANHIAIVKKFRPFIQHIIIVFIASLPSAVLIYYINLLFRNIAFSPDNWLWLWSTVFVIGMSIMTLKFFSHFGKSLSKKEIHKKDVANIYIETDKNILQFFDLLPDNIGSDLLSLSMHDHYLEVVTKKGKKMLHLKFSKAMEMLENYHGVRIHRSHWVAIKAIKSVKKNGRVKSVTLIDGRVLPVSEKYKDALKDL